MYMFELVARACLLLINWMYFLVYLNVTIVYNIYFIQMHNL